MKVQRSTSSTYTSPFQSQSSTDSGDGTPFTLPDEKDQQQESFSTGSSSTSSPASSISAAFWLNQSSSSTGATSTGSSSSTLESTDAGSSIDGSADILSEFAKLANMTPAEKIRDEYLKAHNMTEAQFSQLSPDEQKAINDQIADQIKQQLSAGKKDANGDESEAASSLSIT